MPDQGVDVRATQCDSRVAFHADNETHRFVSLVVTPTGENLANCEAPFTVLLEPLCKDRAVGEVWQLDEKLRWTWKFKWEFTWGDVNAEHDDAVLYRLPFRDSSSPLRCCRRARDTTFSTSSMSCSHVPPQFHSSVCPRDA